MDYSSSKACNYHKMKHKWDTYRTYRYITLWTSKTWTLKTSPPARPLFVDQLPLEIHVTPSQCNEKKLALPNFQESLHDFPPWCLDHHGSKHDPKFQSFLLHSCYKLSYPASHHGRHESSIGQGFNIEATGPCKWRFVDLLPPCDFEFPASKWETLTRDAIEKYKKHGYIMIHMIIDTVLSEFFCSTPNVAFTTLSHCTKGNQHYHIFFGSCHPEWWCCTYQKFNWISCASEIFNFSCCHCCASSCSFLSS